MTRAALITALICSGLALGACSLGMAALDVALIPLGEDPNCHSGGIGGCSNPKPNLYCGHGVYIKKAGDPCP